MDVQNERDDDLSEMGEAAENVLRTRETPLLPGAEGRRYDLISVGEAMLRFTPPNGLRIEQTLSLDLAVGGAELNVAVAMSRIGGRTAWLSKLPDTALGHILGNQARVHGVDTSHIIWTDAADSRLGLFFLESGAVPRAGEIIYDRRASAAATMTPDDWDWKTLLRETRVLHITGITPALSESCRALTFAAVAAAKEAGCGVSCDLNY
ncbi:MAG: PfkB family carbohydrate kinase, partial [Thermomicrobia bacterium]|nr:PfkB family carbohydrate kinase [Thermomicrobia bacterium]